MAGVPMNSEMAALMQMRQNQPQPLGANQQTGGGPQAGPPDAPPGPQGPNQAPQAPEDPSMPPGAPQGPPGASPLEAMGQASVGGANIQKLVMMLEALQKMYPQLKLADHKNGHAEMAGPTQEQFLGSAWAKHHGAATHHVANHGHGQRLHLSWK